MNAANHQHSPEQPQLPTPAAASLAAIAAAAFPAATAAAVAASAALVVHVVGSPPCVLSCPLLFGYPGGQAQASDRGAAAPLMLLDLRQQYWTPNPSVMTATSCGAAAMPSVAIIG